MALFQTGTGYRDPNKAMTIKALQERQKLAAAEMTKASAMPQQIASPWQGAAYLGNILGSGVQQGRADAQEADARQRLTELISGVDPATGPTQAQYAQMRSLDPDMADRQYEAAMAERWRDENRKDEQGFTRSEREAGQGFTSSERVAGEAADINKLGVADKFGDENAVRDAKIAEEAAVADAARSSDKAEQDALLEMPDYQIDLMVENGAMTPEEGERRKAENATKVTNEGVKAGAEATEAVQEATPAAPMTPEEAARWGGDVAKHPGDWYLDPKDGRPKKLAEYNAGAAAQDKVTWDAKGTLNSIDASMNELTRALELAPKVLPGGRLGQGYADIAGYDVTGTLGGERVDATKRFNQIMESGAMKRMAEELKGSTAYQEIQTYVRILADPQTSTEVKQQTIAAFLNKLQTERELMREKLRSMGGEDVGDYQYANPDVMPGTTGTDAAAPDATELSDEDLLKKYR